MRKLLGLALAAAVLFGATSAKAEILKNFKADGQLYLLGVYDKNTQNAVNDINSQTLPKLYLGMGFDLLDDVHAKVTFSKDNIYWGSYSAGGKGESIFYGLLYSVYMDEAYVAIDNMFDKFSGKVGRQYYGQEGDMVMYYGKKLEEEGSSSDDAGGIDMLKLDLTGVEDLAVTAFYARAHTTATSRVTSGDNLWSVNANAKLSPVTIGAGIYYAEDLFAANPYLSNRVYLGDIRLAYNEGGFNIGGEFAFNFGSYHPLADTAYTYKGNAYKIHAGYKPEEAGVDIHAFWANGSGNKDSQTDYKGYVSMNEDTRFGMIYGNSDFLTDYGYNNNTLQNLQAWNVGLGYTPTFANQLTVSGDYFNFKRNESEAGYIASGNMGGELDIKVNWKHNEALSYGVGYGVFWLGTALKDYVGSTYANPTKIESFVNLKF